MRTLVPALLATLLAAACASSGDGDAARGDRLVPACSWPPAADTWDPVTETGCLPRSMFQICEVPEGSVIHPDGTITTPEGTTVRCDDPCTPDEFVLACRGTTEPPTEIPEPAPGLECSFIPIPTPPTANFRCCRCGS